MVDNHYILVDVKPEHYERFRSMAQDLLPTYEEHETEMKQQERLAFQRGMKTLWVAVTPDEFTVYCDERGWAYNTVNLLRCAQAKAAHMKQPGQVISDYGLLNPED
jgi:hypothetical protein